MKIGDNHFVPDEVVESSPLPFWVCTIPFGIGVVSVVKFLFTFQAQLPFIAIGYCTTAAVLFVYCATRKNIVKLPHPVTIIMALIFYVVSLKGLIYMPEPMDIYKKFSDDVAFLTFSSFVGLIGVPLSTWAMIGLATYSDGKSIEHVRVRGAQLTKRDQFLKLYEKKEGKEHTPVTLGTLPMPKAAERLHTLIAAATGSGKSQTLMQLLKSIRDRGDRAVILDNAGELGARFMRPGDLSIDPFSSNGEGWRLSREARHRVDWERLAAAFVPEGSGNSREWHAMAKAMFAAVGGSLWEAAGSELTNADLQRALVAYSPADLQPHVQGTSVEALATDDERAASRLQSVRMSFIDSLKSWQYVKDGGFSFRSWITRRDDSWLFVPYGDFNLPITRQLISAWMDILISSALEAGENRSGRMTWIIIDELDSLGKIPSLLTGVARLRKTGVAVVAVVQNAAQLVDTYGEQGAATLSNNLSSKVVFRFSHPDEAEQMSKLLGEVEVMETRESYSTDREGKTVSTDLKVRRLVMASEIMSLPDLHGYVKFAGPWPVVPVVVPFFEANDELTAPIKEAAHVSD